MGLTKQAMLEGADNETTAMAVADYLIELGIINLPTEVLQLLLITISGELDKR